MCMALRSEPRKRWTVQDVESSTPQLARMIAATYNVRIGEVIDEALYHLQEWLEETKDLPDGWTPFHD
jgi:hypothetical protein